MLTVVLTNDPDERPHVDTLAFERMVIGLTTTTLERAHAHLNPATCKVVLRGSKIRFLKQLELDSFRRAYANLFGSTIPVVEQFY